MLKAWRLVREKYAAAAFSGDGAAKYGGRWNLPGVPMAYTSESQSLAALELLVHLNPPIYLKYKAIRIQFDESLAEFLKAEELPPDWKAEPPSLTTQRLGSRWARSFRTAILAVPSAIVPGEVNYLINPFHPAFAKIQFDPPGDFSLDSRLIK